MNVNNMQWMLLNYKLNYRIVDLAFVWQVAPPPSLLVCQHFVSIVVCKYLH